MVQYFRGKPACDCLIEWLGWYERVLLWRGVIQVRIDVFQLIGGAAASAGTHLGGGAYDIAQRSTEAVLVARQMGAAAWARTPEQGFSLAHQHGILIGCPHNVGGGYQIEAYRAGFNGLGRGGRGGRDDGPRLPLIRTWSQGIEWAKAQQPKALPPRAIRTREQLKTDIAESTREIKRIKAARDVARGRGEDVTVYRAALAALREARARQRAARQALAKAPKR